MAIITPTALGAVTPLRTDRRVPEMVTEGLGVVGHFSL